MSKEVIYTTFCFNCGNNWSGIVIRQCDQCGEQENIRAFVLYSKVIPKTEKQ